MAGPDLLHHLVTDLERLREVRADQLTDEVTGCPGWDVSRLIDHLGRVHRMVVAAVDTADPTVFNGFPGRSGLGGEALLAWFADGATDLVTTLCGTDPDTPAATFVGPRTVGWWIRRQAHEHAVHRWDAEAASAQPAPIPAELAVDGVSEILELHADRGWVPPEGVAGSIHLHGTDAPGEWLLELDGGLRWREGHHKGDVAVRGPVSDLDLLLWGRVPASRLEVLGDAELLDRFLEAF